MHLEERILRLANGASVHCRVWSPRDADPAEHALLLLHGVESHGQWFEELAPHLTAAGVAVYAPDRSGWGQSPGPRGHLESYEDALGFVEQLAAMLRLRHSHVHLGGLSWGGKLALYAALRRPLLCETLTLIAPGLRMRTPLSPGRKLRIGLNLLLGDGKGAVPLPIREEDFTARADRTSFIRTDTYRIRRVTASFCLESLKMDRFIDEHITQLRMPVQLLLAGEDRIVDSAAAEKAVRLAGSSHQTVIWHETAAHSLVFETPERTARETAAFVQAPPPPRSGKRVLVMGAGAVGSMVGGLLAHGGHDVTLVGREAHVEAINRTGLRLRTGLTSRMVRAGLRAVTNPAEAETEHAIDLVILCVKSFDTEAAVEALRPVLRPGAPVLSLQNGVRNEDRLAVLCPEQPVLAGAICQYLLFEEPGAILSAGDRGGLALGPLRPDDEPAAARAHAILSDTGMEAVYATDGRRVKWSKLMLNVAFNALNALTGLGAGELLRRPPLGRLVVGALRECAQVMDAEGVAPVDLPGYPVARLARVVRLPRGLARRLITLAQRSDAGEVSSMAQDLARGRSRTEIDELNGLVARLAETHRIPAPANRRLADLMERAAAEPDLVGELADRPERIALGW